ncbi:hypothetical protein BDW22DRAFT_303537 [Trametopsis cervina]|nr:hypothetical protein BDW22DRAFT_303537 [Trametopsis cervina]
MTSLRLWQFLLYLVAVYTLLASSQETPSLPETPPTHNDSQLICVSFGTCEPCPEDALKEPFCQPFGNRRLMHCAPASSTTFPQSHSHPPHPHTPASPSSFQGDAHAGEIPAWESCGRIVEKERADFYEFLACNVGIGLVAVGLVLVRSKQLQAMQARQLAARIGLTRRVPGGWVG